MSFTSDVKHEITKTQLDEKEKKAQLAGLLLVRASMNRNWQGVYLSFQSENAAVAKHFFSLIKSLYAAEPRLSVLKKMRLKKNNIYRIQVYEKGEEILQDLGILRPSGLHEVPSYALTRSEKCSRAFLAGCFLASGSVNAPVSSKYHLEIRCEHESLAGFIIKQMERFFLPAKMSRRKQQYLVYLKQSEKIADFLRLVQANDALFEFEDSRIQRDFYNSIQRLDNCELANEVKSLKAGARQLKAIQALEENGMLSSLDEKTRRALEVRKKYPESSVNELCEEMLIAYGESISKSGMKHRLNKLIDLAGPFLEKEETA